MSNPCKWRRATRSEPPAGAGNATPNFEKSRKIAKLVMIFDLEYPNFSHENPNFPQNPLKTEAVYSQTHLSPSSRGVGWANGCRGILIATHTSHVATLWTSGGRGNIISKGLRKIRTFFYLFPSRRAI